MAELAGRQHGLVALAQLRELGLTASGVRSRVAGGRLHRIHQGVYAVGHRLSTRESRWMAAVMACGSEAVLSHRSAAGLWGVLPDSRASIDVIAPNRRGRFPSGIDAHRNGSLLPEDRTAHRGIPCTSIARTLLDLAGVIREERLRYAIAEAEVLGLFDLAAVQDVVARGRGRRGVAKLRLLVSELDPQAGLAKSELERRFLTFCRRAFLPAPEVNVPISVRGGEVIADFVWRDAQLIVEADGLQFHGTRSAFERDRRRGSTSRSCRVASGAMHLAPGDD